MTQAKETTRIGAALVAGAIGLLLAAPQALAQDMPRHKAQVHHHQARASGDQRDSYNQGRPLTIGRNPWTVTTGLHAGIMVRRNEIYAPGGFSAHNYGQRLASVEAMRNAQRNAALRDSADVYLEGYPGLDGLGVSREGGYDNPSYGNSYNRYIGYNGVPSDLAFGPAYGNRYATDHDPSQDDDDDAAPSPSPLDLGFVRAGAVPSDQ